MTGIGAKVVTGAPEGDFDLVTMPCHCPDTFLENCTYRERVWFSQCVNMFMEDRRKRIEVTGVKGKTSTCYILAHILDACGYTVYLSTSRGAGPFVGGRHDIQRLVSIAPPYLLELPAGDYDYMINEISLGGSGKADVACITNILDDYGIAKNSRRAHEAKKDVLTAHGINLAPPGDVDVWKPYGKEITPFAVSVGIVGKPVFGKGLEISLDYDGPTSVTLDPGYLSVEYLTAIEAACSIAHALRIPRDDVVGALKTFKGVPGRGEISEKNGVKTVFERNPGISHTSVRWTLSCLERMNALDRAVLIIDPVSKKVCDKLDRDLIEKVAEEFGVPLIVTKGDGTEPEVSPEYRTVIRMIKEGYQ